MGYEKTKYMPSVPVLSRMMNMTHTLTTLAVLSLLTCAGADTFCLTDAVGKQQGPFDFGEGAKLSLEGREYTLSKIMTPEENVIEKMKAITIPEIDFRQANLQDIICFLTEASREYDRQDIPVEERGTSVVCNLGQSEVAAPLPSTDPFTAFPQPVDIRPITLNLRNISLYDTMNFLCKLGDLEWSVQGSVVLIEPKELNDPAQSRTDRGRKLASSTNAMETAAPAP